jgi:DNA invertase Pin-like site-specific DNA recombinase
LPDITVLTDAPAKMTMQVISAVAEFERDLLLERTHSGIARAKAAGRPFTLNEEQQRVVINRISAGISISTLPCLSQRLIINDLLLVLLDTSRIFIVLPDFAALLLRLYSKGFTA